VEVLVTDKAGVIAPYADNLIRFEDRGPARHGSPLRHSASRRRAAMPRQAKIIGVNNGDLTSSKSCKASHRWAYSGRCLVMIQTEIHGDKIELTSHSKGLKKGQVL